MSKEYVLWIKGTQTPVLNDDQLNHAQIVDYEQLGHKDIDEIVAKLGEPVSSKKFLNGVRNRISDYGHDIHLTIDEARQFKELAHKVQHTVYCPEYFLEKYKKYNVHVTRDLDTNKVLSVVKIATLDDEKILADWKEAGCPKNWGFE